MTLFHYKPAINIEQFFNDGFSEQKSIMVCEIIDNVKRMLKARNGKKAKPAPKVKPRAGKHSWCYNDYRRTKYLQRAQCFIET